MHIWRTARAPRPWSQFVIDFPGDESLIAARFIHQAPMAKNTPEPASPIGEISHGPSAFESFLDRNQKSMILLAIVIALAAGSWVVISGMEEGKRLAAGEALVGATDLAAMQDVVSDHGGTPAASSGAVLLSDMQWDEGQQSAAIETLRAEIAANPDHPVTVPARVRLATRLLQQGDTEGARSGFQEIVDRPEAAYMAPLALLSLSEIAREEGDIEAARKFLDEAAENYPDNPLRSLVTQAITYVDFEMPEAIDPPEPDPIEENPGGAAPGVGPEPDLSKPVELDPTDTGTGSGNPLFDSLTGGATPTEDTPPEEAPVEDTPVEDAPEPGPAEEDAGAPPSEEDETDPESGE